MGEFAKFHGRTIKIGTCTSMYYCRYDQVSEIKYGDMCHGLCWRIPAFEEDGIQPGDYTFGALVETLGPLRSIRLKNIDEEFDGITQTPGLIQLRNDRSGMVVNVKCYHGRKLPESDGDFKAFYNGKRETLHLQALKNCKDDLRVVFACSACGSAWNCSFEEIYLNIADVRMLFRLYAQINRYNEVPGMAWRYDIQGYELERRELVHEPYGTREAIKKTYIRAWTKIEDGKLIHIIGANVNDINGNEVKDVERRGTDFAGILLEVAKEAGFEDELLYMSELPEAYKGQKIYREDKKTTL